MTEITSNTTIDLLATENYMKLLRYVINVCVIDDSLIIINLID